MRNVLVPTDFSTASLQLAEKAAQSVKGTPVNIVLFHAFEIPFFATDVFRLPVKPPYQELLTEDFRNACKQLKLQYPTLIRSINFKHMYGDTVAVFRNFVDANDIDAIFFPDYYVFTKVHSSSVNPAPLFKKAGVPIIKAAVQQKKFVEINADLVKQLSAEIKDEIIAIESKEKVLQKGDNYAAKK